MNIFKIDPAVKSSNFFDVRHNGFRILLEFSTGLIGSVAGFGVGLFAALLTLCVSRPSSSSPATGDYIEASICPNVPAFVILIVVYFGALFGVWLGSRLIKHKINYFYLIITAVILLAIQFFISKVFSNAIILKFNGLSIFGAPLILAIVANWFMPKQAK